MSSHEPAPGDAETAQAVARNHVVVTGAGFTRALVPGAPLLVDDFNNDDLEDKVRGLPNASRLLDWERSLHPSGDIDIERLMTRLDALMPYDYAESAGNAANEYGFLLSELKRAFLGRLREARKGAVHRAELKRFAKYCEANGCCCITFNHDDFLDEALAQTGGWNPYWGYGFFCPSSLDTIASPEGLETHSVLRARRWRACALRRAGRGRREVRGREAEEIEQRQAGGTGRHRLRGRGQNRHHRSERPGHESGQGEGGRVHRQGGPPGVRRREHHPRRHRVLRRGRGLHRARDHETVKHSVSEYILGKAHTNGIESFWSMLDRAHQGTFHKMSPKHPNRYVQEFAGKKNFR